MPAVHDRLTPVAIEKECSKGAFRRLACFVGLKGAAQTMANASLLAAHTCAGPVLRTCSPGLPAPSASVARKVATTDAMAVKALVGGTSKDTVNVDAMSPFEMAAADDTATTSMSPFEMAAADDTATTSTQSDGMATSSDLTPMVSQAGSQTSEPPNEVPPDASLTSEAPTEVATTAAADTAFMGSSKIVAKVWPVVNMQAKQGATVVVPRMDITTLPRDSASTKRKPSTSGRSGLSGKAVSPRSPRGWAVGSAGGVAASRSPTRSGSVELLQRKLSGNVKRKVSNVEEIEKEHLASPAPMASSLRSPRMVLQKSLGSCKPFSK